MVHLLPFALLQLFVLIPKAIHLQVKEVGKVLTDLSTTGAPSTSTLVLLLLELDLPEHRLCPQKVLEGPLFWRQSVRRLALIQLRKRTFHLFDSERKLRGHLPHFFGSSREPTLELSDEGIDLVPQACLGQTDGRDVLKHQFGRDLAPIAAYIERCRHDLPLALRELARHGVATAATAAPTAAAPTLFCLTEVLRERAHLDEEEIGSGLSLLRVWAIVERAHMVGDEVAGFEVELLQKEGVPCRHLSKPRAGLG